MIISSVQLKAIYRILAVNAALTEKMRANIQALAAETMGRSYPQFTVLYGRIGARPECPVHSSEMVVKVENHVGLRDSILEALASEYKIDAKALLSAEGKQLFFAQGGAKLKDGPTFHWSLAIYCDVAA